MRQWLHGKKKEGRGTIAARSKDERGKQVREEADRSTRLGYQKQITLSQPPPPALTKHPREAISTKIEQHDFGKDEIKGGKSRTSPYPKSDQKMEKGAGGGIPPCGKREKFPTVGKKRERTTIKKKKGGQASI